MALKPCRGTFTLLVTFLFVEPARADPAEVELEAVYTAEVFGNARGGLSQGVRYLDNLDLTAAVDLDRTIDWRGATLFAYLLANSGSAFSSDLTGDIQGVSNIDTEGAVRLYEAWIDQELSDGRLSLRAGLYDLNSEFDNNDTAALFLNSSHGVGPDLSQTGANGPSIFPSTSLAFRVEWRPTGYWRARAAILDGVPGDPEHSRRTAIKLGNGDGLLLIGEIDHVAEGHKIGLGYWRYTAKFDAVSAELVDRARGNDGAYAFAQVRLIGDGRGRDRGLYGFTRVGVARQRFNPIQHYVGAGIAYTGVLSRRPNDQIGLAVAWAGFGRQYAFASARAGRRIDGDELKIELTGRMEIDKSLTLQPDLQYIMNPSGVAGRRDALAIGLRAEVTF